MLHKFLSFLILSALFFTYPISLKALSIEHDIKHAKLSNGLDVYVVPNHRIPAVFHAVIYKVGGMDDPIGKAGLAHYFEHLMFETTGKFTDIEATMSSIGAQFNAFTTKEYTCYYELVPKKIYHLQWKLKQTEWEILMLLKIK